MLRFAQHDKFAVFGMKEMLRFAQHDKFAVFGIFAFGDYCNTRLFGLCDKSIEHAVEQHHQHESQSKTYCTYVALFSALR